MVAKVILKQTNKRLDEPYDYRIPEEMAEAVRPGVRVVAPFGLGDRLLEGFVLEIAAGTDYPGELKALAAVIDREPVLTPEQLSLCLWMRRQCCALFYEVLALFTHPVKVVRRGGGLAAYDGSTIRPEKMYRLTEEGRQAKTRGKNMQAILALLAQGDVSEDEIKERLGDAASSRRDLMKKGWIAEYEHPVVREDRPVYAAGSFPAALTEPAAALYREYTQCRQPGKPAFFYIGDDAPEGFDLTLKLAADALAAGGSALILFPENGIAAKYAARFSEVFGGAGAIAQGRMNQQEKHRLYTQVREGRVRAVMGTPTALFLPFVNLKTILVEREGDPAYVVATAPHYHTEQVAAHYARITGASIVLTAAVPSMETAWAVGQGQVTAVGCPDQGSGKTVELVDMQGEMRRGNLDFMSGSLVQAMEEALAAGQMVLLMLNRLGYATYTFCRDCGHVAKCPRCGVSLRATRDGRLTCPYCGYGEKLTRTCPQCGSRRFRPMGFGLDQAWERLTERYPQTAILRLDAQAVRRKGDWLRINREIAAGRWQVVVGTRALLKGFDYPQVGLAAAILIDGDLNQQGYRAAESVYRLYRRFFALSAGRAMAQTYAPEDGTLEAIAAGDDEVFFKAERFYRQAMGYPPFGHLVFLSVFGKEEARVKGDAWTLYRELEKADWRGADHTVYKPAAAGVRPGSGKAQWRVVVKARQEEAVLDTLWACIKAGHIESLASQVSVEMDPADS